MLLFAKNDRETYKRKYKFKGYAQMLKSENEIFEEEVVGSANLFK